MNLDKILEMLGIDKLDESKKSEVVEKLQSILEVKAEELSKDKLNEEKEKLAEEYEQKFEEYKEDITSKFSNFVDSVLDEELNIPEKVMEYARKGELYEDVIEQLKVRLSIDEGLLDNEVKDLLREAKETIKSLRDEVNTLTESKFELEDDAKKMAAALYLREKCEGLTEARKKRVMSLLEDITDKEKIDKKFDIVLESIKLDEQEDEDDDEDMNDCVCPECGKMHRVKGACPMSKCPECKVALEEKKADESVIEGKDDQPLNEDDDSPFSKAMSIWTKIAKEGKV